MPDRPLWADEFSEACQQRASMYRVLSSVYFKEVTDEFIKRIEALPLPDEQDAPELLGAMRELKRYLLHKGPDPRTELAVDYAHVFLAAGVYEGDAACPFESIYTSEKGLIMQDARDEVRAVYIANGVDVDHELHLPEDHLAFELEFLAIMSDRVAEMLAPDASGPEGALAGGELLKTLESNIVTQRTFVGDHLLNWLPKLEEKVVELSAQGFYPAMMHLTQAYVACDAALLDEMIGVVRAQAQEG